MTRLPLLALMGALIAAPAVAQDTYVSIFGGATDLNDPTFSGNVATPAGVGPQSLGTSFDTGATIGGAVGRSFGSLGGNTRLRGEVELSFARNDVDGIAFSGNGPGAEVNVDGDFRTTRLFANGLVDFQTGGAFTPYIGAGLGVARVESDLVYGPGVRLRDTDNGLSAQLIAGTSYALSDSLSVTGDIRYIRDFDVELQRFAPTGALTGVVEDDIDTVSVTLGLRYQF